MLRVICASVLIVLLFASTARADTADARFERIEKLTAYLITLHRFDDAEILLRARVARDPEPRLRLLLARIFYLQGRSRIGNWLVARTFKYADPKLKRELIALKERYRNWRVDWGYNFQLIRTRNPNGQSRGGDNYVGARHRLTANMRMPWRSLMRFNYAFTDYETNRADRHSGSLDLESAIFGHDWLTPFVKFEGFRNLSSGYRDLTRSAGLRQRFRTRWGGLDIEAARGEIVARDNKGASGTRYTGDISYRPPTQTLGQSYSLFWRDYRLNDTAQASEQVGAAISLQSSFAGFFGTLSWRGAHRRFTMRRTRLGVREDKQRHVSLELCRSVNRRAALCLYAAQDKTDSSIDFFDTETPNYSLYVRGLSF